MPRKPPPPAKISPAEAIDTEPPKPRGPRLSVGDRVWFIDSGARWFLLEVVEKRASQGRAVTFKPVTGWDSERQAEWALGALLEFPVHSALYKRLRPLSARRP